jgi:hypothetical protein
MLSQRREGAKGWVAFPRLENHHQDTKDTKQEMRLFMRRDSLLSPNALTQSLSPQAMRERRNRVWVSLFEQESTAIVSEPEPWTGAHLWPSAAICGQRVRTLRFLGSPVVKTMSHATRATHETPCDVAPLRENCCRSSVDVMPSVCLPTNLRPEAELLLCCARLALPAGGSERMAHLVQSNLDWTLVLQLAARHRLLPLLYRHLDALPSGAVPRAFRMELWVMHERTVRHNQVLIDELLQILQLLESHGIAAIPYKGPVLTVTIYRDLALRPFEDLDILVRPPDLLSARDLLLAQGYRPLFTLLPTQEAAYLRGRANHHLGLVRDDRNIYVELHWKTGRDGALFPATDDWLWADLVTVNLGETTVRYFGAETLLLLLCLHGAAHQWESLGWLVDVAELMRQHPQLDWARLATAAAELSCERRLAVGLYLAHQLLDAPLPEPIRRRIAAQPRVETIAREISERLFQPDAPALSPFALVFFDIKLLDRWSQRLRDLLGVISPTLLEWGRWPLPRCLSFLYYPLRLSRLLVKYGRMFLARHMKAS